MNYSLSDESGQSLRDARLMGPAVEGYTRTYVYLLYNSKLLTTVTIQ